MRRFWFEFEGTRPFSPLGLGCGITARDKDDAMNILREKMFEDGELPIRRFVQDVSIDELDANHVIPNIGNIFLRGIWFPQGY
jgi:hypothetical protein